MRSFALSLAVNRNSAHSGSEDTLATSASHALTHLFEDLSARLADTAGDIAQGAQQRVGRSVPCLLVGAGGIARLVADRGRSVVGAPRVIPRQDAAVLARSGPRAQFSQAHHGVWMAVPHQAHQLQHAVPRILGRVVPADLLPARPHATLYPPKTP